MSSRANQDHAAMLLHDLKNFLMPLMHWLEQAEEDFTAGKLRASDLQRITEYTYFLADLVKGESKKTLIELNSLISNTFRRKIKLPKNILLDIIPGIEEYWIFGRENELIRVFSNLTWNARYAMPGGGRLRIQIMSSPKFGQVRITFSDTGMGIPPEALSQVFSPNFSGRGGTGLGLTFVEKTIDAHQGTIKVSSALGKGTSFDIDLPLHVPELDQTQLIQQQNEGEQLQQ